MPGILWERRLARSRRCPLKDCSSGLYFKMGDEFAENMSSDGHLPPYQNLFPSEKNTSQNLPPGDGTFWPLVRFF